MSYVVKFIISLLIFLIACVLWYLSQIIDWDEYTPKKDCSDFAEWFLFNKNTFEFEFIRLIFILLLSAGVSLAVKHFG